MAPENEERRTHKTAIDMAALIFNISLLFVRYPSQSNDLPSAAAPLLNINMAHGRAAKARSISPEYPAVNMLYPLMTSSGRQYPSISCCQILRVGQQCTHCMVALTAMARLVVTRMAITTLWAQPCEMRRSVKAKDVLLQAAARISRKPAMVEMRRVVSSLRGSTSELLRPKPRVVSTVWRTHERMMDIYLFVSWCRPCDDAMRCDYLPKQQ